MRKRIVPHIEKQRMQSNLTAGDHYEWNKLHLDDPRRNLDRILDAMDCQIELIRRREPEEFQDRQEVAYHESYKSWSKNPGYEPFSTPVLAGGTGHSAAALKTADRKIVPREWCDNNGVIKDLDKIAWTKGGPVKQPMPQCFHWTSSSLESKPWGKYTGYKCCMGDACLYRHDKASLPTQESEAAKVTVQMENGLSKAQIPATIKDCMKMFSTEFRYHLGKAKTEKSSSAAATQASQDKIYKCFHRNSSDNFIADCPTCPEEKKTKGKGKGKKGGKAKPKAKAKVAAASSNDNGAAASAGAEATESAENTTSKVQKLTRASRRNIAAAIDGTGLSVDALAKLVHFQRPTKKLYVFPHVCRGVWRNDNQSRHGFSLRNMEDAGH